MQAATRPVISDFAVCSFFISLFVGKVLLSFEWAATLVHFHFLWHAQPQGRFNLGRVSPLNAKPLLRAVPPAILYWVTDTRNKRTSTMILEVSSCKSDLCVISMMDLGISTYRERVLSEATTHSHAPFSGSCDHAPWRNFDDDTYVPCCLSAMGVHVP